MRVPVHVYVHISGEWREFSEEMIPTEFYKLYPINHFKCGTVYKYFAVYFAVYIFKHIL